MLERGIPGGQMANTERCRKLAQYESIFRTNLSNKMFEHAKEICGWYDHTGDVKKVIDGKEYKQLLW